MWKYCHICRPCIYQNCHIIIFFSLFQFCLALRYYATGSFFSAIGDTQGVHKSTVSHAVSDVTNFLVNTCHLYIKFPRREDFAFCAQDFAALHGFPCVIGCVDGTHIAIQSPVEDERTFVNRKGYHSINVMVSTLHPQYSECNRKRTKPLSICRVIQDGMHGSQRRFKNKFQCFSRTKY